MLASTTASAVQQHSNFSEWVRIVTGFTSILTSWAEFGECSRKIVRYNRAIESIKNLLTWWEQLDEVEKNAVDNFYRQVSKGESIITSELGAWQSTARSDNSIVIAGSYHEKDADPESALEKGFGGMRQRSNYLRIYQTSKVSPSVVQ